MTKVAKDLGRQAPVAHRLKLTDTPSRADGKQWQWWRLVYGDFPSWENVRPT